jgi:ribosomal protein S18 acetylase RimI-like enzyme
MSPAATVRRASPDDAQAVAKLLHDFDTEYDMPTPEVSVLAERYAELLENGEVTVLITGDGLEGFAQLRFRPSVYAKALDAYLEELYVIPSRRGQGFGRALLEAAMKEARDRGAVHIDLGTSETDTAARGLYESAGFTNREGKPDGPVMLYYERDL